MIIVSPLREIEACELRGLFKLPRFRQALFLNSAITSLVRSPPMINAALVLAAVE